MLNGPGGHTSDMKIVHECIDLSWKYQAGRVVLLFTGRSNLLLVWPTSCTPAVGNNNNNNLFSIA